jgi:hypothetical protein
MKAKEKWHLENGSEIPKCICGKPKKWNSKKAKYVFCSASCSAKQSIITQKNNNGNDSVLLSKRMLRKYGTDNPQKIKEFKEKQKITITKKYGCDNVMKSEIVKNKLKKTLNEKYNVSHNSQTNSFKEKMKNNHILKWTNKIGNNYVLLKHDNIECTLYHKECNTEFKILRETLKTRFYTKSEICTKCNPIDDHKSFLKKKLKDL